jgi:hypothetical protein
VSSLHLILGLMLVSQQPEEPTVKDADLEKSLNEDVVGASVITVLTSGDLVLFDGAITVPAQRPSVEECGVLMSMSRQERAAELAAHRKKADDESHSRGLSQRERMTYVQRALAPKKECQALFKRKCDEIKQRVPVEARKASIEDAKKSIDRLLADTKVKKTIQEYLTNVVAECSLAQ